MTTLSKAGYARHRGLSRQSVDKMIESGRLSGRALTPDGKIVVDEADKQVDGEVADTVPALATSKARRAHADAQRAELDLAQRRGQLVDKAATLLAVRQMAQAERDAILAWPARAAPILAAEFGADPHALQVALDESLRAHLTARAEGSGQDL